MDSTGKIYNIEIQRSDEGANPKRARYNHSLIDSREISRGTAYKDYPEVWVIFITENDIFKAGLPMYHIERIITELNRPFADAAHTIYVNGSYRGEDALGLLMHDFFCPDPSRMHYPILARRADFFKHENKGVKAMCEIMKELMKELTDKNRTEVRDEERTNTALEMLRDNEPMDKIIKYSRLSRERIEELALQIR